MTSKIKIPRSVYPESSEIDYFRNLLSTYQDWVSEIKPYLVKSIFSKLDYYQDWQEVNGLLLPRNDANFWDVMHAKWGKLVAKFESKTLKSIALSVNTTNFYNFERQVKAAKKIKDRAASNSVNLFKKPSWLDKEVADFSRENSLLIRSIGDDTARKIEVMVTDAVKRGVSAKTLEHDIAKVTGFGEHRCALISRDQIGKLNGQITQLRHTKYGIEEYIWASMKDQRVRDTHRNLEGTRHRWDKPPAEGHPGQPIRCRCLALPVFDEL